jgi:hypothetical protein
MNWRKGLGVFNIIWSVLIFFAVGLGGPPMPPFGSQETILLVIFYITLGVVIFLKYTKTCKIVLAGCTVLTALALFSAAFFFRQKLLSDATIYAGIFLFPLVLNFIILIRSKARK